MLEFVASASILSAVVFGAIRRFRHRQGFLLDTGRWYEAYVEAGDLPCPWCHAPTKETDTACPSCRRSFGAPVS